MSTDIGQVVVSVAQVALGGSIVQGVLALTRRRGELKQLDRQSDSVVVESANNLVQMHRAALESAEKKIAELTDSREDMRRQLQSLAERLSALQADLAILQADNTRLSLELQRQQSGPGRNPNQ